MLKLYDSDATDTKYYTTKDIRDEELRIVRIADKVNSQIHFNNIIKIKSDIANLTSVNEAQRASLQHILINSQGIRILRGREPALVNRKYLLSLIKLLLIMGKIL